MPPPRQQQGTLTSSFRATKGGATVKTKRKLAEPKKSVVTNQKSPAATVKKDDEPPRHSDLAQLDPNDPNLKKIAKSIEAQRISSPIHQENTSSAEKILLNFDLSSQYGPCAGLTRLQRWNRADRLGLNPPKVVLEMLQTQQGSTDPVYKESFLYDRGI